MQVIDKTINHQNANKEKAKRIYILPKPLFLINCGLAFALST